MHVFAQGLLSLFGTLASYAVFSLARFLYEQLTSPLRDMVGPNNPSLFFGHSMELHDNPGRTATWKDQYGLNFQMRGFLSTRELYTADTKALNHIAVHSNLYQKPPFVRYLMAQIVGTGLLVVEGDAHKAQRKILNPAFGVPQIRELTSVFVEKSIQLRNILANEIASKQGSVARIDILQLISRMTLDVIGQAGFNHNLKALIPGDTPSELNNAFTQILHTPQSTFTRGLHFLQAAIPIFRPLPIPGSRVVRDAQASMSRIGGEILAESRASLKNGFGGEDTRRRDLMSLLLKANTAADMPLCDKDLISQMPSFLVAGHETTSTATAWALYALARNQGAQQKLREELLAVDAEDPTLDELNALPYLESVIRETMRVHSPVAHTSRMAMADDIIPLSRPYVDGAGRTHESLRISKSQIIHVPILDVNTDKEIWGEDAQVFRPERWEDIPEAASAVPGVWAHLLTFLAGPRNCIGYRFALAEMKALLFVLIRAFEFETDIPEGGVGRTGRAIQHPLLLSERNKGSQMPLIVKLYREQA
ncbi:cytochrome P450 [Mycena epipterygia]|nr:cytochrome P450 [Mycena epipterygia]